MLYLFLITALIWFLINAMSFAWLSRKIGAFKTSFLRSLCISLILLPVLWLWDITTLGFHEWLAIWWIWILVATSMVANLKSFDYLPVWVSTAIFSTNNIIVLILWYLFYNETLSLYWYIWAALVLSASVWLALFKSNHEHLKPNYMIWIGLAIYRAVTHAIWVFSFAYLSREANLFTSIYFAEFSILFWSLVFLIYYLIKDKRYLSDITEKDLWKAFLISIFPSIWVISLFKATTLTEVWHVSLFLAANWVLVAVFSRFIYNEPLKKMQWLFIWLSLIWMIFLAFHKLH